MTDTNSTDGPILKTGEGGRVRTLGQTWRVPENGVAHYIVAVAQHHHLLGAEKMRALPKVIHMDSQCPSARRILGAKVKILSMKGREYENKSPRRKCTSEN
jgi:hypothetical protein